MFYTRLYKFRSEVDKMKIMRKLFILLGPTSVGKTSLGVNLCKKFNGEIISADSRQVVKYMDIGTGKMPVNDNYTVEKNPNTWIINGVNIWGYDLALPTQYFSGYDFATFAINTLHDLMQKEKTIFVVGGTGFYIDLITGSAKVAPAAPDLDLRADLENMSLEELQEKLKSKDKIVYDRIDIKNKVRLVRALEILASNSVKDIPLPYPSNITYKFIGLTSDRATLYSRADAWLDTVWKHGLLEEVRTLLDKYPSSLKLNGLVYKSVVAFLHGDLSEEKAKERAKFDIHAYIRRQQTWFKKNHEIEWFDIKDPKYRQNIEDLVSLNTNG